MPSNNTPIISISSGFIFEKQNPLLCSWHETNRFLFGRTAWSVGSEADRSVRNGGANEYYDFSSHTSRTREKTLSRLSPCNQSMSTQTARTERRVNHRHVVDTLWTRCGNVVETLWTRRCDQSPIIRYIQTKSGVDTHREVYMISHPLKLLSCWRLS